MAVRKVKDLVVSSGTYTDSSGQQKHRYVNIGAAMKNDDGSGFLLIHRHINLAGLPFKEGSESVIVNMYDPNQNQQGQRTQGNNNTTQQRAPAQPPQQGIVDDDIPF